MAAIMEIRGDWSRRHVPSPHKAVLINICRGGSNPTAAVFQ